MQSNNITKAISLLNTSSYNKIIVFIQSIRAIVKQIALVFEVFGGFLICVGSCGRNENRNGEHLKGRWHCQDFRILFIYSQYLKINCILGAAYLWQCQQRRIVQVYLQIGIALYNTMDKSQQYSLYFRTELPNQSLLHQLQGINERYQSPPSIEQNWNEITKDFKLIVLSHHYTVLIKHISFARSEMNLRAVIAHSNGETLKIPSPYRSTFCQMLNIAECLTYFFQDQTQELALKYKMPYDECPKLEDVVDEAIGKIRSHEKIFLNSLYSLGIIRMKNKYSLLLKKAQLTLKKNVREIIEAHEKITPPMVIPVRKEQTVKKLRSIVEVVEKGSDEEVSRPKRGGYFQVQKKKYKIVLDDGVERVKNLAHKVARKSKKMSVNPHIKLKRQVELVSKIADNKHLVTYYTNEKQIDSLYMDFVPETLKEYIYKKQMSLEQILNFSSQMIDAVSMLHRSGVIHRDLKPENILIESKEGGKVLKVIDFGESTKKNQFYEKGNFLGCTLPYSPIECLFNGEEGFNKEEIDFWSVTLILYEISFKSIPLTYSRYVGADIIESWKTPGNFSIFPVFRKKSGLQKVEQIMSLTAMAGLQLKQSDRLSLYSLAKIIKTVQQFHNQIFDIQYFFNRC